MESLIVFILIAAGSAIVNWMKRRGEKETDWTEVEAPPPPPRPVRQQGPPPLARTHSPPPQAEPKMVDWEAELRRMLGQPEEQHQPVPPPVYEPAPPPIPPPVFKSAPPPQRRFEAPPPPPVAAPVYVETHIDEEEGPAQAVTLNPANVVYDRASHLDETVRKHLEHITHSRIGMTSTVYGRHRSPEVAEVIRLFHSPRTARQIILASVILAPPKALQDS